MKEFSAIKDNIKTTVFIIEINRRALNSSILEKIARLNKIDIPIIAKYRYQKIFIALLSFL